MKKTNLATSFTEYSAKLILEESDNELSVDSTIIEKIVELAGDEDIVEECAREAFEDLQRSFDRNEIELKEGDTSDKLAFASLIVKLVEKGKIGPQDADQFIADNL